MDVPTKPGDALAQPTRAQLFALLGELRRPASTEELAERVGLHPNGVRAHLERLQEAGLLVREREQQARGRPRDVWCISPDAQPGGDPPTAYADLGRWLVRAISSPKTGVRDIEATGRKIGRELAPQGDDASAEEQLRGALVALGFQPARELQPPDRLTYHLRNCPYREAVRERQQVVCGLHRGLTRGLLDAIDPKTKLTGFVPRDPYEAGCLIKLRGPLASESAADATDDGPPAGQE
jgi:predicted ArsR family transcriptional regulator